MVDKKFIKDFALNLDKVIKDPNTIINISGDNITLSTYKDKERKSGLDMFSNNKFNFIVYWDDIIQYTSLGFLSWLIEKKSIDSTNLNIDNFFKRKETDGIRYISNLLKLKYKELCGLFKQYYQNILLISPMSNIFGSLINMQSIINNLTFVFKHSFEEIDDIIKDIQDNNLTNLSINYIISEGEEISKIIPKNLIDVVFTVDMGAALEYVVTEKILDATIIGPEYHYNITDEYMTYYLVIGEEYSIYNSKLIFYKEEILNTKK